MRYPVKSAVPEIFQVTFSEIDEIDLQVNDNHDDRSLIIWLHNKSLNNVQSHRVLV